MYQFGTVFQYKYVWSKTSLLATHAGWLGTSRPHFWFVFLATRAAQSGLPTKITVHVGSYIHPYLITSTAIPAAAQWAAMGEDAVDEAGLVPETHQFVPLGFEAGGGFGPATLRFLQDVEQVAGAQASADLYHWSAMMWGEHWRQRLSLGLARGRQTSCSRL